ncbi:hypothetical protein TYRP_001761 [Tyrophagus putrescentiae]|nr:hypothetical protein TYRP_001761 [Tyrophagus putrescentiae]
MKTNKEEKLKRPGGNNGASSTEQSIETAVQTKLCSLGKVSLCAGIEEGGTTGTKANSALKALGRQVTFGAELHHQLLARREQLQQRRLPTEERHQRRGVHVGAVEDLDHIRAEHTTYLWSCREKLTSRKSSRTRSLGCARKRYSHLAVFGYVDGYCGL